MKAQWETHLLGGLCDKYNGLIQTGPFGSQLHQHDYTECGTPVVMPKDIVGNKIALDRIARISDENVDRLSKHKLEVGDILLPRRGEISKSALITNSEQGFICGTGCLKIVPPKILDSSFFSYLLNTEHVIAWLESNAVGATMLNLSGAILKKLPVVVPPLPTQRKIAHTLSAYDDLIENNLKRIKLLEETAQITYEQWFVRMKFPGHETTPIDAETGLPEEWVRKKCFDFMDVLSGGTPKTTIEEYWDGGIKFFTPKDATNGVYTEETEKAITQLGLEKCNSKLYPKDTVFITARGTVGKLNLASEPMVMNQSCYALQAKEGLTQFFLYCALSKAIGAFKGAASGGVFDTIVVDTFKFLPFIKPTQSLIDAFGSKITPLFGSINVLLGQNLRLREARDILLPRLMTGMIDVDHVELPAAQPDSEAA